MALELFTVGYEGYHIDGFIAHLKNHSINCLLDVREIPLSRKKGFSKSALAQRLQKEKITYLHLKALGSPKPIRNKLKENGDYGSFFKKMNEHLNNETETIEEAYHYIVQKKCCLMCFEHPAHNCHRIAVANKIKERDGNGLVINNI
ncbi:MAG: DUF488 domain-containing protein [Sedimentisphaerales bacterium]|nr:DUF488 domain-containing protein [Sedimentisphaerales bacterium]